MTSLLEHAVSLGHIFKRILFLLDFSLVAHKLAVALLCPSTCRSVGEEYYLLVKLFEAKDPAASIPQRL